MPQFVYNYYPATDSSGYTPTNLASGGGYGGILDASGTSYTFDSSGNETTITDTNGNAIHVSSTGWTDTYGRSISGSRTGAGTLAFPNDPNPIPLGWGGGVGAGI